MIMQRIDTLSYTSHFTYAHTHTHKQAHARTHARLLYLTKLPHMALRRIGLPRTKTVFTGRRNSSCLVFSDAVVWERHEGLFSK